MNVYCRKWFVERILLRQLHSHGLLLLALLLLNLLVFASGTTNWANHGGNILNHRSANSRIGVENVAQLELRWKVDVGGDVTATPAIAAAEGVIYFPSFNAGLWAVEAESGRVLWQRNLSHLVPGGLARATPALAGPLLLVSFLYPPMVMAFDRASGDTVWSTARLDAHPASIITMSGTVHDGFYYVGTSSIEETFTTNCCYFQGSVLKLRVSNGEVMWQTSMLPDNGGHVGGYAGAAVWGSSPSIDESRGLLFVATGNNYQVPESVVECKKKYAQGNGSSDGFIPDPCLDANNHADSIVALEMSSGKIAWSRHLGGYDVFSAICSNDTTKTTQCASTLGPDYDFGEAPMVLHVPLSPLSHNKTCIVVAGQKSGIIWALECSSGRIVWWKRAGPGSALGGSTWGSTTDRKHIYTNVANFYNLDFELRSSNGRHTNITNGGGWVALDASTGDIMWAIPNLAPNIDPSVKGGAPPFGPLSTSHGIVWVTSFDVDGHVYALHAHTGSILWEYHTGATIYGGFSIGLSCVYVGHGYIESAAIGGTQGSNVFAFCLPLSNFCKYCYGTQGHFLSPLPYP